MILNDPPKRLHVSWSAKDAAGGWEAFEIWVTRPDGTQVKALLGLDGHERALLDWYELPWWKRLTQRKPRR